MFASPPKAKYRFEYSILVDSKWTELAAPLLEYVEGSRRFPSSRGYQRMSVFFSGEPDADAVPESDLAIYYQQVANYYCRGDGKVSGIKMVRFYLRKTPFAPYGSHQSVEKESLQALYEQECG